VNGKRRSKSIARVRKSARRLSSHSTTQKPVRAVFLVGFMGAGKSSVGRALAQHLNWSFEDLDQRIEAREQRTVAEIFRNSGEQAFRLAERVALEEVLEESGRAEKIIALGGGAFVQKEIAALLKSAGVPTIFLDARAEELWQRCRKQADDMGTERPLLGDRGQFSLLYETRRRAYLKASHRIDTTGREIAAITKEIAEALKALRRSRAVRKN
jgi:shikimate kinase